jgi:hypothetical protein
MSSLSRVRVPWYSWPYFTVSNLRLPFLSPRLWSGQVRLLYDFNFRSRPGSLYKPHADSIGNTPRQGSIWRVSNPLLRDCLRNGWLLIALPWTYLLQIRYNMKCYILILAIFPNGEGANSSAKFSNLYSRGQIFQFFEVQCNWHRTAHVFPQFLQVNNRPFISLKEIRQAIFSLLNFKIIFYSDLSSII